jgi:DNA-binding IclR family transcriptional regulator
MPKQMKQQGVQSIEIGFRLLKCLEESKRAMMLRDLAAAARMPAAKAHRYLVSLVRMRLVEQQADTGMYDLGAYALDLGLSALGRLEPLAAAAPFLRELHTETGQTVALAVLANRGATIVSWLGSDAPVAASLRVGSVMPLTRSATGLAFLAFSPRRLTAEQLKEELLDNGRKALAPKSAAEIEQVVERTRRQGFARTSDFIPGISGLAVPVFDQSDSMTLAMVILGYTGNIDLRDNGPLVAKVLATAGALSARLGWRPAAAGGDPNE